MRRLFSFIALLLLVSLVLLLAPAAPAMWRYGGLPLPAKRPINVLLAGVTPVYPPGPVWPYPAAPEDFSGLTDTIVLLQVQPDGKAHTLSIPRDSWVEIPGHGPSKINSSNARGGPELLVETVQNLTGLNIDGYALLSLSAARAITDAAGGVPILIDQDMKYDDDAGHLHIDLQRGLHTLNGEQMEGYLRFRKDGMGDIGRVARQQKFLTAFERHLNTPQHAWRWPMVVGALHANTKSNLERQHVGAIVAAALRGPTLQTHMVPGNFGDSGTWAVNRPELRKLVDAHFSSMPLQTEFGPTNPFNARKSPDPHMQILVLNAGAPAGSAGRVADNLRSLGFQNVEASNAERQQTHSTFQGLGAQQLQTAMGFGRVQSGKPEAADLVIYLGRDLPLP